MAAPKPLTKNQAESLYLDLTLSKRPWTDKIKHCLKQIKPFYPEIDETSLKWYIEVYVPSEIKRHHQIFLAKSATGELHNRYTPTDVSNSVRNENVFQTIKNPTVGVKYHLSWAFKGAVFVLRKIEGDYCYLDNPRNPRKELLKAKIADLRSTNKNRTR